MARIPVIKTTNLCKYYQMGKTTVRANQKINLEVYAGEFIIIFGPSGCGKSTLMSLLAGLDEPTSGEILIRGEKLNNLGSRELAKYRRTKIGMIFQQYNLIKTMTAVENVALPLAFDGKSKRVRLQRALNCLEMVELAGLKDHTPAELSGGQQQKLAIARAWVASPWIVLADEPTGNLDSKSSDEIIRLLKHLNEKSRRTVVLITHNPEYLKFADRVVYLKDGIITKITRKGKRIIRKKPKANLDFLDIDPKLKRALKKTGLKSAQDLIKAKIADLIEIPGINDIEAAKIQKEATQFLEKEGELVPVGEIPEESSGIESEARENFDINNEEKESDSVNEEEEKNNEI